MRRAAAGVAAALALVVPAVAHASASHDAAVARRGITHALKQHWLKPPDAQRYRAAVSRALRDVKVLAPLRTYAIASQLSQLTPLWDSYTSPRAPGAKIRLGLLSSDLKRHPVGYFVEPLFEHLDPQRFELFCYAFDREPGDDLQAA